MAKYSFQASYCAGKSCGCMVLVSTIQSVPCGGAIAAGDFDANETVASAAPSTIASNMPVESDATHMSLPERLTSESSAGIGSSCSIIRVGGMPTEVETLLVFSEISRGASLCSSTETMADGVRAALNASMRVLSPVKENA